MERLDWSAPYHAPESIAQALWDIEPGVELLYLADGMWALVSRPERWTLQDGGARRRLTGTNILRNERKKRNPSAVTLRSAELLVEGCAIIAQPIWDHAPDHSIVEWFREADYLTRMGGLDAAMDARDRVSNGQTQDEEMKTRLLDWRETEGRSTYRHVFKGRRSIVSSGLHAA